MIAPASRAVLRHTSHLRQTQCRRLLSTAPPHLKSRSWRNSAIRWGIAIGGLYYYNTSSIFAEEPPFSPSLAHPTTPAETSYPTLDSIKLSKAPPPAPPSPTTSIADQTPVSKTPTPAPPSPTTSIADPTLDALNDPRPAGLEETEEEAAQEGAFNEETGEINWDCPCLGGMAHGPCGEQFREAFSCFVYSNEEPKGMDCIDRFKGMQDCFRLHPDVYGDELADPGPPEDDEPAIADAVDAAVEGIAQDAPITAMPASSDAPSASALSQPNSDADLKPRQPPPETPSPPTPSDASIHPAETTDDNDTAKTEKAKLATEKVKRDHKTGGDETLVPKEWHDTRQMNDGK